MPNKQTSPQGSRSEKNWNTIYYDYCNLIGHTKATFYKHHGYPTNFKGKKRHTFEPPTTAHYTCSDTNNTGSILGCFVAPIKPDDVMLGVTSTISNPMERSIVVRSQEPQYTQDQTSKSFNCLTKKIMATQ